MVCYCRQRESVCLCSLVCSIPSISPFVHWFSYLLTVMPVSKKNKPSQLQLFLEPTTNIWGVLNFINKRHAVKLSRPAPFVVLRWQQHRPPPPPLSRQQYSLPEFFLTRFSNISNSVDAIQQMQWFYFWTFLPLIWMDLFDLASPMLQQGVHLF